MNRFDIGVVVVTFVILGVAAIIRNVVVPIVRFRVSRYRLASNGPQNDQLTGQHSRVDELEGRKLELENSISLDELTGPLGTTAKDQVQ